jgi:hypothetical protein
VVSQLPLTLRLQLSIVMNKRLFEKMPLFKDLPHNEPPIALDIALTLTLSQH